MSIHRPFIYFFKLTIINPTMKKIFLTLMVSVLTLSAVHAQNSELPNTEIQNFNAQKVPFKSIVQPGKITLISFWATWCKACKHEIHNIGKNLKQWQSEVPEFDFITISQDESKNVANAKAYATAQGWEFPTYLDPNSDLSRSLNFQTIPFTLIIDQNGKIVYQHSGYKKGDEIVLFEKIKEIAGK